MFILPNFAMLLAVRCIDAFAYKRLRVVEGAFKYLMLEMLIVEALHFTLSVLEVLLSFYVDRAFLMSSALFVPVFTVIALILSYCFDRKRTNDVEAVKGSFRSNLIISLAYDILYGVFFYRYFLMEISWEKSESVKSDTILIVAIAVLFVIGTVWKMIDTKRRIRDIERGTENK